MKTFSLSTFVGALLFISSNACAQNMYDLTFNNVINHKTDQLNLRDYRGKYILLDFWAFQCYPCIQAFPKIDSFQNKFGNNIQIILINKESKTKTEDFFNKRKQIHKPNLPIIAGDSILHERFPHSGAPHYVWIDTMGQVMSNTNYHVITENIIKNIINNEERNFKEHKLSRYANTLFEDTLESNLLSYSYIARCINQGALRIKGRENYSNQISSYHCVSPVQLYQQAYDFYTQRGYFVRPNRTIVEVKDSFKFIKPKNHDSIYSFYANNSYYYHILLRPDSKEKKHEKMIADLNSYFDLDVKLEQRKIKCWTIIRKGKMTPLISKGGKSQSNFFIFNLKDTVYNQKRSIVNKPWQYLTLIFERLIENKFNEPFENDLQFEHNIDLSFPGLVLDNFNITEINQELKKFNIKLVKRTKKILVLVIKEKQ